MKYTAGDSVAVVVSKEALSYSDPTTNGSESDSVVEPGDSSSTTRFQMIKIASDSVV